MIAAVAAQQPIGPPAACGAGKTVKIVCYMDDWNYVAEVQLINSERVTPAYICGSQQLQLQRAQAEVLEPSASDHFVWFQACTDMEGLRGMVFRTALGAELSCGVSGSNCRRFTSRSTYPLRGFQGTCDRLNHGHQHALDSSSSSRTRVTSITAACWAVQRQSPTQRE